MAGEGYLIVTRPERLVDRYEQTFLRHEHQGFYRELRSATSLVDPRSYRGMSRDALEAYPSLDPEVVEAFRASGRNVDSDRRARMHLLELIGPETSDEFDPCLMNTFDQAREVRNLTDEPDSWEIVYASASSLRPTEQTLGIDLGWWGLEFYSIIWDTIVCPTWHPPQPMDFAQLADKARGLNEHVLFDTAEEATDFRRWYETKEWAERDNFVLVRVDAADEDHRGQP